MSKFAYPRARILVFAREPVAGKVKTRLQASLGPDGCLRLYQALLARAVALAERESVAPWQLWVSSNPNHKYFISLCNKSDIYLQEGPDLGARMDHASRFVLGQEQVDSVLIIGSDCPLLTPDYLARALSALEQHELVLGPAEDGGYVLIGLRQAQAALFSGLDWGTDRVLAQTLSIAEDLELSTDLLPVLWDVDTAADLDRLAEQDKEMRALLADIGWSGLLGKA
jgi:rSAM/selenodomain-associated transferase 1